MADAGPVFIVAGVVFAVLAAWAVYVNVRGGADWAQNETPPNVAPESTSASAPDAKADDEATS